MGDTNGVIYAIDTAGAFFFYQNYGTNDNPMWFNAGNGRRLGSGFNNFTRVFGGRDGVIYCVTDEGNLYYYRDLARNGTTNFANSGLPLVLAHGGWSSFRDVFSPG